MLVTFSHLLRSRLLDYLVTFRPVPFLPTTYLFIAHLCRGHVEDGKGGGSHIRRHQTKHRHRKKKTRHQRRDGSRWRLSVKNNGLSGCRTKRFLQPALRSGVLVLPLARLCETVAHRWRILKWRLLAKQTIY